MPRLRRRVLLGIAIPVVVVLLGLIGARNREPLRRTALSLAETAHSETAVDVLRYSSHCYNLQDWLLLSSEGSVSLWQAMYDSDDTLRRWLPRDQREPILRTLRDIHWGPPPSDSDIERVLTVVLDTKREMHGPLSDRLLPILCQRYLKTSPAQRAFVEKRIRFLATSTDPVDRYNYAHSQLYSDSDAASLPVLRKLLKDSEERPRAQAIWALGNRGDASLEPLLPVLPDDPSRMVRSAWSVVHWRYNSPALMARLWKDAYSTISSERSTAIHALDRHPNSFQRKHIPLLRKILQEPDISLRRISAFHLMRLNDEASKPAIRKMLSSSNPEERQAGMMVVWQTNDRSALPEIRKLANDKACGPMATSILQQWDPTYKRPLSKPLEFLQGLMFQGFQH
ncbi:MAG: HEAT repeat domain-containing protein [Armatimonas sp.]